jgi:hypothetical protein
MAGTRVKKNSKKNTKQPKKDKESIFSQVNISFSYFTMILGEGKSNPKNLIALDTRLHIVLRKIKHISEKCQLLRVLIR